MKILTLTFALSALLLAQFQPGRNQLSGSVVGPDKKPVPNASLVIAAVPPSGDALLTFLPYNLRLDLSPAGTFTARDVPDGTYRLCPGARDAFLLNPCQWRKPVEVTVRGGQTLAVPALELVPAERMTVSVDDPAGHLRANLGKSARAEYQLTVVTSQGLPASARLLAQRPNGDDYEVLVAPDQSVDLIVSSGFFRFGDNQNRGLARRDLSAGA